MTRGMTRRGLLIAGAGAGVAGLAYWGRFALGDTFEAHVAETLGLEEQVTRELLETMREELGLEYDARAASFVAATTAPTRWVMPGGARREALESFVGQLFGLQQGYVTPFVYGGLRESGSFRGCNGLVRS
jgi:hypothetical protein